MADFSCDFCTHDNECPYSYQQSNCYIESIKAARSVVDDDFKTFLTTLEAKNENIDDDNIDNIIRNMRYLINDSEQTLPDWATKE